MMWNWTFLWKKYEIFITQILNVTYKLYSVYPHESCIIT